jgi:hypothetical protein
MEQEYNEKCFVFEHHLSYIMRWVGVSSLGCGSPNDVTSILVFTQNEHRNECSHNL